MARFTGKVAIVTGGGSGIGAGIALRLASEGASVMLAGRTLEKLETIAAEIRAAGGIAACQITDVSVEADMDRLIAETVAKFGQLDVLINNAGSGGLSRTVNMTTEQWRHMTATDYDSVFFGARAAIPHLQKTRGNIVNISSVSGLGGDAGMGPYNGTKAAVINFTRSLAVECAEFGIRVNSISPGLIETPTLVPVIGFSGPEWVARIPLGRVGQPDEIGACAAFLASDDASFVTGHNLVADGGATAQTGQPNMLKLVGM